MVAVYTILDIEIIVFSVIPNHSQIAHHYKAETQHQAKGNDTTKQYKVFEYSRIYISSIKASY